MDANNWQTYDGVESQPEILSGAMVLKGTRVPVDLIAECLDAGETVEEISYNYDLQPQDVMRLKLYRDNHLPAFQH